MQYVHAAQAYAFDKYIVHHRGDQPRYVSDCKWVGKAVAAGESLFTSYGCVGADDWRQLFACFRPCEEHSVRKVLARRIVEDVRMGRCSLADERKRHCAQRRLAGP